MFVDFLCGLCIKVPTDDKGDLGSLGNVLQVLEEVTALCRSKLLPASSCFEVGDSDAEQLPCLRALQRLCYGHLVSFKSHSSQSDVGAID